MSDTSQLALSQLAPSVQPSVFGITLGRREWLLVAFAIIAAGAALNWSWLTAIGVAPLIVSLAPCALMCAAGVCMMGGSKSCGNKSAPADKPDLARD